jgi:P-type Cu2+ transporter
VLIVTCPCALSLAAPSALLAAATRMAQGGLVLRNLAAVEDLARMQLLLVDKTGTLTQPAVANDDLALLPQLQRTGTGSGTVGAAFTDAQLWAHAASLAAWSSHPLARGLAAAVQAASATPLLAWHCVQELPGVGVQAQAADGSVWRLGKGPLARADSSAAVPASLHTTLWHNGQSVATFTQTEQLRPGALAAVQALQASGVQLRVLSGDHPARVQHLARQLGLGQTAAQAMGGLSPSDKLAVLQAAQASGSFVAMLGDGINDAPVLAQANLALAMGDGAHIARTQADGVLVSGRLADLVQARALAQQAVAVVQQNFMWAAGYNLACVPLAVLGYLPPWAAGLGMATSSLVVVANSARLLRHHSGSGPGQP